MRELYFQLGRLVLTCNLSIGQYFYFVKLPLCYFFHVIFRIIVYAKFWDSGRPVSHIITIALFVYFLIKRSLQGLNLISVMTENSYIDYYMITARRFSLQCDKKPYTRSYLVLHVNRHFRTIGRIIGNPQLSTGKYVNVF